MQIELVPFISDFWFAEIPFTYLHTLFYLFYKARLLLTEPSPHYIFTLQGQRNKKKLAINDIYKSHKLV